MGERLVCETLRKGSPTTVGDEPRASAGVGFRKPSPAALAGTAERSLGTSEPSLKPLISHGKTHTNNNSSHNGNSKKHHFLVENNTTRKNISLACQTINNKVGSKESNIGVAARLHAHFRRALRNATHDRKRVYLELFAGVGHVSKFLHKKGYAVITVDIIHGPEFDVLNKSVFNTIVGWIKSGAVAGVWLGTPCASWSRARHGPPLSSWCAIRDNTHLFGLPNLNPRDQDKIRIGNATMNFTAVVIKLWRETGCSCIFGKPRGVHALACTSYCQCLCCRC